MVLDPILAELNVVARGLKTGGFAVLNTLKPPEQIDYTKRLSRVGVVDATGVAIKTLKAPISNTAILGAFIKTVGMLKLSSVEEAIRQVLPERLHAANIEALRLAYEETRVREA